MKHRMADPGWVTIFDENNKMDLPEVVCKYLVNLGAQAQRDKIVGPYASSGRVDPLQVLKDTAS